jgi:tRNA threonylcarbamoyladenosine biosynthesis protein TsaE
MKINITDLAKTEEVGKGIADYLSNFAGLAIFYLDGDLGTGKTTLVREVLKNLGWNGAVKSPTFSILEEYKLNGRDIYHSDLYRLNNENDFEMLGLEINEKSTGILFIEWPNKISKFNFGNEFFLKLIIEEKQRLIEFQTSNQEFLNCINRINIQNPI